MGRHFIFYIMLLLAAIAELRVRFPKTPSFVYRAVQSVCGELQAYKHQTVTRYLIATGCLLLTYLKQSVVVPLTI